MKKIFFIYWVWYALTLWLSSVAWDSILMIKTLTISTFISFSFIAFAPIYYLIYERRGKSSDASYLNACLNSGIIRVVVWCFAFFGNSDTLTILALNAFGMLIFILIESKLKKLSNEYFNY